MVAVLPGKVGVRMFVVMVRSRRVGMRTVGMDVTGMALGLRPPAALVVSVAFVATAGRLVDPDGFFRPMAAPAGTGHQRAQAE